jgi:thiol-disulfide isomerase/thioredoxin
MTLIRRLPAFVVVVAVGALAACGGSDDPGASTTPAPTTSPPAASPTTPSPTTTAPTTPPSAAVPEVLDFTAQTVAGTPFNGADLAGKPAIVWFWAPWCPVCKAGASDVAAAATELGDDVTVVGVGGLSGSEDDMTAFVEDTDTQQFSHIVDTDGAVFTRFGVTQQDTFAFISADGTVDLVDGYGSDPDLVGLARERFGL